MAATILVTGATGFVGRALVPVLAAAGFRVSILVREAYAHPDFQPLPQELTAVRDQFQVVYADLRNFQLTVRAVREVEPELVVHLAAAGVVDPFLGVDPAIRQNVTGTLNLVRACFEKTGTTRQLIVARTPGEQDSMNVYAASKAAAWNFCQMYGRTQNWPIHGAMIFQTYGPGQSLPHLIPAAIVAACAGHNFPMTTGEQQRDWIYIADVVAGLQALLGAQLPSGETVELGSGQMVTVAEVVRHIYHIANKGGEPLIGALSSRPGETAVQVADAARTQALIGWGTTVSLTEGLRKTLFTAV